MLRKKSKKATHLVQKVNRWEGHMGDKTDSVRKLPPSLDSLVKGDVEEEPIKRRKTIYSKPDDDPTTKACVAIANEHSQRSNADNVKLPSKTLEHSHTTSGRQKLKIEIHTNVHPISQMEADFPTKSANPDQSSHSLSKTISGETFGMAQLSNIFDESQSHWNRRTSQKTEEGITGIRKEEVSRHHISKVLWAFTDKRPFVECVMGQKGFCRAQIEPGLRHPFANNAACMAYYSAREYEAVLAGVPIDEAKVRKEFCEFCYRHFVDCDVERIKHASHRSENEIPYRYYKAGIPGEYSVAGMHQPVEKKTTQYPDGILGHMRKFNVSDFVPVVARLVGTELSEVWHADEFRRRREAGELDPADTYIYGWEETKPIHQLNNSAFFEVNQIDPYERVYIDTSEELTVSATLRDYFERRAITIEQNYVHIFQDLMECVRDELYLFFPHAYTKALGLKQNPCTIFSEEDCWLRWCLHDTRKPLDFSTHSIYYTLLVKINTCKEIAHFNRPMSVSEHIKQKIRKYLSSHYDLIAWMRDNNALSDEAIHSGRVIDPVLGSEVPVLFAYYPRDVYHYRIQDFEFSQFRKTIRHRDDPLTICKRRYITEASQRQEHPLVQLLYEFEPPSKAHGDTLPTHYMSQMKKRFDKNVQAFKCPDVEFVWHNPDIGSVRRDIWDHEDNHNFTAEAIRGLALNKVLETVKADFSAVQTEAERRSQEYRDLVELCAPYVFCDFKETCWWLLNNDHLEYIIEYAQCFRTMMPDQGVRIQLTPSTVNGVSWRKYCNFAACLFRSYVAERLHALEPPELHKERYNLILFRNSHLALFRKITETPEHLMSDVDLNTKRGNQTITCFEQFYPYPQREIHQGLLPDYVDSLTKVNFISEGGMDDFAWIKMQFKKPDRCCDGREFHEMLRTMCMQDPTFFRYTCLELELSFKGLYEHCTVVPSFARTVFVEEIFDNAQQNQHVRDTIFRMIVDNQTLIAEATSESLCYMLEYAAPLRDVLKEVYRDWFSWRVKANMDMARKCFDVDGNFSRVAKIVYERIKLHSNKIIYRHTETNFIIWLCNYLKKFDEQRFRTTAKARARAGDVLETGRTSQPVQTEFKGQLNYRERLIVNKVIGYLGPTQPIDATDLELVGMNKHTVDILYGLHEIFSYQVNKSLGIVDRESSLPTGNVFEHLSRFQPKQHELVGFFFHALQRYQTIRTTRINNFNILEKQKDALLQKYGYNSLAELPPSTMMTVFSTCCLNVKTTFTRRPNQFAVGCEDVYYSPMDNTYTCAKKEHRTGKRKNANSQATPKRARNALKREQELRKPICAETEVIVIDALGELVETDGCKIPHSKKNNASAEKGNNIAPPTSPYFISPCCGTIFGYRYDNWYPGGYACGTCSTSTKLAETFQSLFCIACKLPVKKDTYTIVKTYDDVFTHRYSRAIFCPRCVKNWRFFSLAVLPVSSIIKGSTNIDYVNGIAQVSNT